MKKIIIACFVGLFMTVFAFAQTAVSLDTALKNSTSYLNDRIPARTKVVVLNFSSKWPELSDYIIEELIGYIVNEGTLTVVDRQNLESIRKEMDFQLSGEVSDDTAQSIGKKIRRANNYFRGNNGDWKRLPSADQGNIGRNRPNTGNAEC